ncbi:hypothetical protein EW146_g6850 [Bondarzewia mesenterica]|uniref:Intradiol ring-cleavage dioxygenases domain-containing protein n=1 Tax=Bondarzewia mesenterica TaxID=1095465 RepID=A0A4S4LP90_9AGAM|nr:hypothetical protein EW146_g6850 [Bondarzewia mesenterica]
MSAQAQAPQGVAKSNGIPPPPFELPVLTSGLPDRPEIITDNLLKLTELAPNPRTRFIFRNLISKLHEFVNETDITTEEWMNTITFLTRTGQTCTPIRQEFILLSDVLGVSALVDALNNPLVGNSTESTVLGPFFTEDAPDVANGDSIASEGKGEYMYVEGRVLTTEGNPIPHAIIETWETDANGFYDTQYADRAQPDCRGRLRSGPDGKFGYRAVVPVPYPIPGDGPVGELLTHLGRHNMRPNHLHMMVEAPGFKKLTTALYPDGDPFIPSDAVFGVKKSLVVVRISPLLPISLPPGLTSCCGAQNLTDVDDDTEARKRGFPQGKKFKLLQFDLILVTEAQSAAARAQQAREAA